MRLIDFLPPSERSGQYDGLMYVNLDHILVGTMDGAKAGHDQQQTLSEERLRLVCDEVCAATGHVSLDEIIAHAAASYTEAMEDLVSLLVLAINAVVGRPSEETELQRAHRLAVRHGWRRVMSSDF